MFVLIFDDNLLSSASLLNQLQSTGHEGIIAGTVEEARRAVPRRPDIILVNLVARSFDPPALIRQLRSEASMHSAPIVAFCGHQDALRKKNAVEAGCHHVISNAQAHKQLVATLEQLTRTGA